MKKIKDLEEKKMIMGYIKVNTKKTNRPIINNLVFHTWICMWPDDFRVNGKCPKIYNNQIIQSKRKYKKGIEIPEIYKLYTERITMITNWINDNCDQKKGRRRKSNHFKNMILEYRKSCYGELLQKLRDSSLESQGYTLGCSSSDLTKLRKYYLCLKGEGGVRKSIMSGSYEEVRDYLNNILGEKDIQM